MMAKYRRGEHDENRKMQWVNWKKIIEEKHNGGLGFRDLYHFNSALLAKQVWRILTQHNLLMSKPLKGKYLHKKPLFGAEVPKAASWTWREFNECQELSGEWTDEEGWKLQENKDLEGQTDSIQQDW